MQTPLKSISVSSSNQLAPPVTPRNENYICLCKKSNAKLNCHKNGCKICTNTLFGYPFYICTLVLAIQLASIGVFGYALYSVIIFKYQNQSYFATCYSNNDCNRTIGLHCSTEDAACNCPARNTKGRCNCNTGNFWNGTHCTLLLKYQQTGCLYDYNCDTSKGLTCVSNTCTCTKPKYWQNSTQICDFTYIGCFIDTGVSPLLSSANNVTRMSYFVETCVNFCSGIMMKYALLSISNFLNTCFCQTYYNITTSSACTARCPGSSENGYICGISTFNSFNTKAVYLAN